MRKLATFLALLAACTAGGTSGRPASRGAAAREGFEGVAAQIGAFVREQMEQKELPAVCVALVDGAGPIWEEGFGFADPKKKIEATAHTVIRAGSVSKLFTDIAVLQLVEREEIDLDDPVTRYVPGFAPRTRFETPITLRQLMCHRSGLCREPPVGHYFDPSYPSLEATVASLARTELVHPPGTVTKYSNAGIGVVGRALELADGRPFAEAVAARVLEPLRLEESSFEITPAVRARLAAAEMWALEGRSFEAPVLMMGAAPAGNLFASVADLGRFASVLLRRGDCGGGRRLLHADTLESMWIPQFDDPARGGFGLGFVVSSLDGKRVVGHGGAIYGFATQLSILPDDDLAVAVAITVDCANSVAAGIAQATLQLALAAREGKPLPTIPRTKAVDPKVARELAGHYRCEGESFDLVERAGRLFLEGPVRRVELRAVDPGGLRVDDRLAYGRDLVPEAGGIRVGRELFQRTERTLPAQPKAEWHDLLGEYGWDHNILYVLERDGELCALIEWFDTYALKEAERDVFRFPPFGLYSDEGLRFTRDEAGKVTGLVAANVYFPRRPGIDAGAGRILPVASITELTEAARRASPPREADPKKAADLVEVVSLDPTIQLDIRYATKDNFLGEPVYPQARAFLQREAGDSLVRAHRWLRERGYGIRIHDGYRPWWVTKVFWDATPQAQKIFVADPSLGSRHNRGCAADVTLFDLATGQAVEMPGEYDEGSARSYPAYPGGTSRQRWHRELLRKAMEANGFEVFPFEWWHFDYQDWRSYPISNAPFEAIGKGR